MPKDCQISWRLNVNIAAVEQQDNSQCILDVSFLRHTLSHVWVSTSKMMSQGRCVWLGILTKCGLLGGLQEQGGWATALDVWGKGGMLKYFSTPPEGEIFTKHKHSAESSSSAALPVCISTGMYFWKYILQLLNCIYYY